MHTHISWRLIASCVTGTLVFIGLAGTVHAETHITADNSYLEEGGVWQASDSPYIIEFPVTIPRGASLVIGPGVSVIASSSIEGYPLFDDSGELFLNGEPGRRITVSGPGEIKVTGSTTITQSDISVADGIAAYGAYVAIASTTMSGSSEGIHVRSSVVAITDSRISNNGTGLIVDPPQTSGIHPVMRVSDPLYGKGGIGNALEGTGLAGDPLLAQAVAQGAPSRVTISSSEITGNTEAAIENSDTSMVEAVNDWWGSDSGPSFSGTNMISGPVAYEPWQKRNAQVAVCCSSVLFLPGIEGTRLYQGVPLVPGHSTTTRRLWEPMTNLNVSSLYLTANGSSSDPGIFSGEPIDSVFGLADIYGRFMTFLDSLVSKGTIREWRSFGYDWREPIDQVVLGREKKATTTASLMDVVARMASSSPTGKVTLIAHSNGGLVAEYLVKALSDAGQSGLIDAVISVAVPYLGTPSALGALLHGDGQSVAGGLIISQANARQLAANTPSVYSLLPSAQYFSQVFSPTIAFASTTEPGLNDGSYPQKIASNTDQSAFVSDAAHARAKASYGDTDTPLTGNSVLLAAANVLHTILDPFVWPATIARWTIIGWGNATAKGIGYSSRILCQATLFGDECHTDVDHSTLTTTMGDGTVIAPSAASAGGNEISLDLQAASSVDGRHISHSNILGASTTRSVIKDILSGAAQQVSLALGAVSPIPGVTLGQPDYSREPDSIVVRTDCPVELNVYDSQGRHTGFTAVPASLKSADAIQAAYEENIPGSSFEASQSDDGWRTIVRLPEDSGERYSVVANGTDFGFFNVEVEGFSHGTSVGKTTYTMEPVTPFMVATTTIGGPMSGPGFRPLSSSTPTVHVDIDGDGMSEYEAVPGLGLPGEATSTTDMSSISLEASRAMAGAIRQVSGKIPGDSTRRARLWLRLDRLIDLVRTRKLKLPSTHQAPPPVHFGHIRLKDMTATEKAGLLDYMDAAVSAVQ